MTPQFVRQLCRMTRPLDNHHYLFFEIAADGQTFALKALDRRRLRSFQNIICVRPAAAEDA